MNKKGEIMKQKRISFGQGKGSLTHNNREFVADNVDPLRTPQNITFVRQPIGEAYDQLFAESTKRYNARQKRNDRMIHGSYYEHLFGVKPCNTVRTAADKRKSFYEDVVQIGKMEDSGYGTEDFQLVADCLKEYMEGFQNRNPNFYVFNAVLHMDEATPHLHFDYIPVGHYKRGQDTQNGIVQALKEMGFGEGKQAIARWRAAEVEVLNAICLEHGIKPLAPEKARGTLEVEEYKEQRRQADELAEQNAQVEAKLGEKREMLKAVKEKTAKLAEIDSIETGKTDVAEVDRSIYDIRDVENDAYRMEAGLTPEIIKEALDTHPEGVIVHMQNGSNSHYIVIASCINPDAADPRDYRFVVYDAAAQKRSEGDGVTFEESISYETLYYRYSSMNSIITFDLAEEEA